MFYALRVREMIVKQLLEELYALTKRIDRPLKLMEVCGTHTVEIFRQGIRSVLPKNITLLSGPGCPVCVTPIRDVDAAISIANIRETILVTFGDMMRVPGGSRSLMDARSLGADVRVLYSPLDALHLAEQERNRQIVFFATGFETTSPLIAGTVFEASRRKIPNFSIYSSHKLVPPALRALLGSPDVQVDGFILPGHVSAMIGSKPYDFVASQHGIPSVITGFDGADIIEGMLMLIRQIEEQEARVEIQYAKIVKGEGNPKAMALLHEVFEPSEASWRGIGVIPESGLRLREKYAVFDAAGRFPIDPSDAQEPELCSCGEILRGVKTPNECPLFGGGCTPEHPVGPCMVSTEGSCAAYYKYGQG